MFGKKFTTILKLHLVQDRQTEVNFCFFAHMTTKKIRSDWLCVVGGLLPPRMATVPAMLGVHSRRNKNARLVTILADCCACTILKT